MSEVCICGQEMAPFYPLVGDVVWLCPYCDAEDDD